MAGKFVARNAIVNFKYITSWKAIARYFLAIVNRRISISHKFVNIYKNTYYLVALKTSTMFNHLPNIFTSLYLINSYIYIFIFLIKSLFLLFRRLNVPLCVCVCVCVYGESCITATRLILKRSFRFSDINVKTWSLQEILRFNLISCYSSITSILLHNLATRAA